MPAAKDWKDRAMQRFWPRVNRTENITDCWLWYRETKSPYPMISFRAINHLPVAAHRVAFYLHYGYVPAPGRHVCHICNNKKCCNPHHLYDGTPKTNHADCVKAGTFKPIVPKRGEDVHNSKLTIATVLLIRRIYPFLRKGEIKEFSRICGIDSHYMRRLAKGMGWAHADSHEATQ